MNELMGEKRKLNQWKNNNLPRNIWHNCPEINVKPRKLLTYKLKTELSSPNSGELREKPRVPIVNKNQSHILKCKVAGEVSQLQIVSKPI